MKDWREGWRVGQSVYYCTFSPSMVCMYQTTVQKIKKVAGALTLVTTHGSRKEILASICGRTAEEAVDAACKSLRKLLDVYQPRKDYIWGEGFRVGQSVYYCTVGPSMGYIYSSSVKEIKKVDGVLLLATTHGFYTDMLVSVCGRTAKEAVEFTCESLGKLLEAKHCKICWV